MQEVARDLRISTCLGACFIISPAECMDRQILKASLDYASLAFVMVAFLAGGKPAHRKPNGLLLVVVVGATILKTASKRPLIKKLY